MRTNIHSKKGFFFTMLAIVLVAIFVLVFTTTINVHQQSIEAAEAESMVINSFTQELQEDFIETAMRVATRNALTAALQYVNTTQQPISAGSLETRMSTLAFDGTYRISEQSAAPTNPPLYDVDFTLVFQNKTENLTQVNTSLLFTNYEFIGGDKAVKQIFTADTDQRLKELKVNIVNDSASSGYLIAAVYNADDELIGYDNEQFQEDGIITFTFDELITLGRNESQTFYIFAPYADVDSFSISTTATNEYDCRPPLATDCFAKIIKFNSGGSSANLPMDILLPNPVIGGNSFSSLMRRLQLLAFNDLNIYTNITTTDFSVDQEESPWEIDVSGTFDVQTAHTTISFNTIGFKETNVSIVGFYDPISLFDAATLGTEPRIINQTLLEAESWTPLLFEEQYYSGTYFAHPSTTSFLKRFTNDQSASTCCGISRILPATLPDPSEEEMYLDDYFNRGQECNELHPHYWLSGLSTLPTTVNFKFNLEFIEFFGLDDNANLHDCSVPES